MKLKMNSKRTQGAMLLMLLAWVSIATGQDKPGGEQAAAPAAVPAGTAAVRGGYVIGAGDLLQITVFKEPEASIPQVVVQLDGVITLPMVKDIHAGGLTTAELEEQLGKQYSRFIRDAEVSVIVKEINSKKIYLIGAVKKEGALALKAPITILQAIAESGGLTDYAKRSKIYILRKVDGKPVRIPFDYLSAIKGEQMDQNILLKADDTIVVPN